MIWVFALAVTLALAIYSAVFLARRALRFGFPKKLYEKNKVLGILSSLWPIAICLPFYLVSGTAFVIAFIHLFLIWALTDATAFIVRKIRKKEKPTRYINGFIALFLTTAYLSYGWIMAHTVIRTDYNLESQKKLSSERIRIVAIADLHAGMTLDEEELLDECEKINATSPDVVVVCGDFVDDDTSYDQMIAACNALGTLKPKYGVYFVFGNHDRGYFAHSSFTTEELCERLSENNVKILIDDVALINDEFYIIGREDAQNKHRKSSDELMKKVDTSKYVIMLDHQPTDYDAIAESAPDLVISGHTHGGHIFPAGPIGMMMGANDSLYGLEVRENTSFIVTSGISGWSIPFKTFAISEFVVIDVYPSK